jgi:hypothetical protein
MLQFYFLSIFMNALAGYFLFFGEEGCPCEFKKDFPIQGETCILITGILSALTGLVKLFSPVGGIPVIGDLIPAITGVLCGFVLLFEYYRRRSSIDNSEHTKRVEGMLVGNRKLIGALAFAAAVLHFLFPRAPFL